MKEHLIHFFPFLNKEFRKLSDDELQSEEVFKELFPNEDIELYKLKAIAAFQKAEENTINFEVEHKVISTIIQKKKPNAKV